MSLHSTLTAQTTDERLSDAENPLPVEVTAGNYAAWRHYILPQDSELEWQKIPWLTSLSAGILEGDRQKKPVLLWAMNGHALQCT